MKRNEWIAEFMNVGHLYEAQSSNQFNKYHLSWDSLMPVVEMIESLGFEFYIVENRCRVCHNTDKSIDELYVLECRTKIETTYEMVIEYITWYNTKHK